MENEHYTRNDVCRLFKIDRSTLWRWENDRDNEFPKPTVIGTIARYKKSEIDEYLKVVEWERRVRSVPRRPKNGGKK